MSDSFGAGVHQPDPGMLQRLIDYLHGRTAAASPDAKDQLQQALSAQAVYGGPQRQGAPFGDIPAAAPVNNAFNAVQTQPLPPPSAPLSQPQPTAVPPPAPTPMDTGISAVLHPAGVSPTVVAYANGGVGQGPFAGQPMGTPSSGIGQGPFAGQPQGTPSATPRAAGAGRDVTVNKKSPWGPEFAPNQDVIGGARSGALGRKMGMFDLSSLFRGSDNG